MSLFFVVITCSLNGIIERNTKRKKEREEPFLFLFICLFIFISEFVFDGLFFISLFLEGFIGGMKKMANRNSEKRRRGK